MDLKKLPNVEDYYINNNFLCIKLTSGDYVRINFNSIEALKQQLSINLVGFSLPSEEEIAIEAERRNPYVKHLVDFNNGMHEGFIDGADFVLEAIKNKK